MNLYFMTTIEAVAFTKIIVRDKFVNTQLYSYKY